MADRLVKWFLWSVLIALLPISYNYLRLATGNSEYGMVQLIEHGELLVIAALLSAKAIGELVGTSEAMRIAKQLAAWVAVIVLALASGYFSHVVATRALVQDVNVGVVCTTSCLLYFASLVAGASCVALAEAR